MTHNFPNDADGAALRRLVGGGSDLTKPMYIDFQIAVPEEAAAKELALAAETLGYKTKVYDSPKCSLPWTCECSTRMLATYDGLLAIQAELAELSSQFGGHPDGWGSFGNVDQEKKP